MKNLNRKKSLSVIIPAKNAAQFIERALHSIVQLDKKIEIIVVENGSSDRTYEILMSLKIPQLKVFQLADANVSSARNFGVAQSQGEVITFLDADDEITLDRLHFIQDYDWEGKEILIGTQILLETEKEFYLEEIKIMLQNSPISFSANSITMTRQVFNLMGGFNPEFKQAEDIELIVRGKIFDIKIHYVDIPFVIRHFHSANISHNREEGKKQLMKVLRKKGVRD